MTTPAAPVSGTSGQTGTSPAKAQPAEAQNIATPAAQQAAQDAKRSSVAADDDRNDGLSADEERQLADLIGKRDRAAARAGGIRLKVEEPHESLTYGGVTVGREFSEVPAHIAAQFTQAAAEAGVTVTQQEDS
jgi:hypothetical protein